MLLINGLPERLKKMRSKHGFSQRAVAEYLGASPSIISGYETGERTPSVEALLSLSYLYRCTTDYLLGKDLNDPQEILCTDGVTDKQIQAIRILSASLNE